MVANTIGRLPAMQAIARRLRTGEIHSAARTTITKGQTFNWRRVPKAAYKGWAHESAHEFWSTLGDLILYEPPDDTGYNGLVELDDPIIRQVRLDPDDLASLSPAAESARRGRKTDPDPLPSPGRGPALMPTEISRAPAPITPISGRAYAPSEPKYPTEISRLAPGERTLAESIAERGGVIGKPRAIPKVGDSFETWFAQFAAKYPTAPMRVIRDAADLKFGKGTVSRRRIYKQMATTRTLSAGNPGFNHN